MKKVVLFIVLVLIQGCSINKSTKIYYSGYFNLDLETDSLVGARIFYSDGLSIKYSDKRLLTGVIITKQLESLPEDFQISNYPEYALGLKKPEGLPEKLSDKFINSYNEFKYSFENPDIETNKSENGVHYTACSTNNCIAYIVFDHVKDQILMLNSIGFSDGEFKRLLKEINYVNN